VSKALAATSKVSKLKETIDEAKIAAAVIAAADAQQPLNEQFRRSTASSGSVRFESGRTRRFTIGLD
jgi:hypothetical protein